MTTARIVVLFVVAALAEIGGAWLIWQAVRENRGWWFALLGPRAGGCCRVVAGAGGAAGRWRGRRALAGPRRAGRPGR